MCRRPAFSFFFVCNAETKHQREAFEYILHLMNGSLEVPRLHLCHHIGGVVKGKAWYSLPYLPVTQASALDLCRDTPSMFPRFLPFLCPAGEHTSVMQIDSSFSLFFQHLLNVGELELQHRGLKDDLQVTPLQSEESGLKFFLQKLHLGIDHSRL